MVKTGILVKYEREKQEIKAQVSFEEVQKAIEEAKKELKKEINSIQTKEHKDILLAQYQMLSDIYLVESIREQGLKSCEESFLEAVSERARLDIGDVFKRIKKPLFSTDKQEIIKEPFILYSDTMFVSELSYFDLSLLQGVLLSTDMSESSHLALVLKSYDIPFIFNYKDKVKDGVKIEIEFETKTKKISAKTAIIRANVNCYEDFAKVNAHEGVDIGLVRSELLFLGQKKMPNEEEQRLMYKKCFSLLTFKQKVNFRVFDFSQDKRFDDVIVRHENALDILIEDNWLLLKTQLEAVLEVYPVQLVLPHVQNVNQIKKVKKLLKEIKRENTPVVAMIESVEAVNKIEQIMEDSAALAIGTNDLFSDYFKVSREEKKMDKDREAGFWTLIQEIVEKAKKRGQKVCVCGEMASNQESATHLEAMGVDILSVNVGCLID